MTMARPLDHAKRAELLAGVIDYIAAHGLTDLSLRPLAAALGTSSRMLIHYFGTKEHMLVAALETQRPNLSVAFVDAHTTGEVREVLHRLWEENAAGETSTSTRVVVQVLAAASVRQGPFLDYANRAVKSFTGGLAAALECLDTPVDEPEAVATILISGLRGLLVDRYVTGDKDRTDRAAYRLIDQSLP